MVGTQGSRGKMATEKRTGEVLPSLRIGQFYNVIQFHSRIENIQYSTIVCIPLLHLTIDRAHLLI